MSWTSLKMSAWVLPAPFGRPCTLSNVNFWLLPYCKSHAMRQVRSLLLCPLCKRSASCAYVSCVKDSGESYYYLRHHLQGVVRRAGNTAGLLQRKRRAHSGNHPAIDVYKLLNFVYRRGYPRALCLVCRCLSGRAHAMAGPGSANRSQKPPTGPTNQHRHCSK